VGDLPHSWGVVLTGIARGDMFKREGGVQETIRGQRWQRGDVIGCACDVDNRAIRFSKNGVWTAPLGLVYDKVEAKGGFVPAVSVNRDFKLQLNFGERPLAFKPPDDSYLPVHKWLVDEQARAKTGGAEKSAVAHPEVKTAQDKPSATQQAVAAVIEAKAELAAKFISPAVEPKPAPPQRKFESVISQLNTVADAMSPGDLQAADADALLASAQKLVARMTELRRGNP